MNDNSNINPNSNKQTELFLEKKITTLSDAENAETTSAQKQIEKDKIDEKLIEKDKNEKKEDSEKSEKDIDEIIYDLDKKLNDTDKLARKLLISEVMKQKQNNLKKEKLDIELKKKTE